MPNAIATQDGSLPEFDAQVVLAPLLEHAQPELGDGGSFPVAKWHRYTFLRRVGHGGMGTVYEAIDPRLHRNVALKFIRGGDPHQTMRLVREARAQARVEHENICKVFEVGEVDGKAYIAMQFVSGETLNKVGPRLSLDEKVILVRDVARALHSAHALGILHRDVKPSNILVEVTPDSRYKPVVMDFGLARDEAENQGMTESGTILGTPAYMSPEQARGGRNVDRRSDVYGLGATLYELISGQAPFSGDTPMNIVLSVLNDEPIALRTIVPSVPADLATITTKCLHKDPVERYESARALADDLDHYLRGEPILGRNESAYRRFFRWASKHRAMVVTTVLAAVAVAFVGAIAIRGSLQAAREKAVVEEQAGIERELGQDIKEMEWLLRTAHTLPLHDVTPERAMVRASMKRIEERAAVGGRTAALVDYAMGRGHLALGEDEDAYRSLTSAQQRGVDSPNLHYALGLVQGRRYQTALLRLRGGGDSHWVESQTKDIEANYLHPALASIEKSRGARIEAPSYLDALIAFYKKDYARAIAFSQKALQEAPWLYEAIALEAESHLSLGNFHKARGEREDAARELDEAIRIFDVACEVGRSDGLLYESNAEARVRKMELLRIHGDSPDNEYAAALASAERAAKARPDRGTPYLKMALALGNVSNSSSSPDPNHTSRLALAIANLERARAIDGETFAINEMQADWLIGSAEYAFSHNLDPHPLLKEGFPYAKKAIAMDPTHPWGWVALGHAHRLLGIAAMNVGEDPQPHYDEAIRAGMKAVQLEDGHGFGWDVAHWSCALQAQWLTSRGKDPKSNIGPECNLFDPCMKANPRGQCQENEAMLTYHMADFLLQAELDPAETIRQTETNLTIAQGILKDNLENRQFFVALRYLQMRDAFRRGVDTTTIHSAFDKSIADCFLINAADATCTLFDAREALLQADMDVASHRSGKQSLEKAASLATHVVARNLRDVDAYHVLAEAKRRAAAIDMTSGQTNTIRDGLLACEQGLAINPHHPRLLLTAGGLRLLEAHRLPTEMRENAAQKVHETIQMAIALNPLLRREAKWVIPELIRLGLREVDFN